MSKSAMPVSKAKTAYALLGEIAALIIEEPKRYAQEVTLMRGADIRDAGFKAPTCGTVGCVAGWVVALKTPHKSPSGVTGLAAEILGLGNGQRGELFWTFPSGRKSQTKSHAEWGSAHIRKFQKKYATQLKAKRV